MFDELFARSKLPQLVVDADNQCVLHFNDAFDDRFGPVVEGSLCSSLIGDVDLSLATDRQNARQSEDHEVEILCRDGCRRRFLIVTQRLELNAQPSLHVTTHEIESIARRNDLLRHTIAGTAAKIGEEYFRALLPTLCRAFRMSIALVARLAKCGTEAQMVGFYVNGTFVPPISYALEGTPCWNVYADSRIHCVLRDVQCAYPDDEDLVTLKASSYLGIPILNEDEETIGHISLLDPDPIRNPADHELQILQIFAARTQAEFRRSDTFLELQRAKASAESANHYKTQFLANMSHELRTPLTVVNGLAEQLELDPAIGPEQLESLKTISRNCDGLTAIISDMLEVSTVELGRTTVYESATSVSDVVEDLVSTYRPLAQKDGVVLTVDVEKEFPKAILTDREKLRRILGNLTGNAIRHTDSGGTVQVTIATTKSADSQLLEVRVADNGEGIEANRLQAIFEPFTKFSETGAGLGLAIAKALTECMQGKIVVDSTAGEGTEFVLFLPLSEVEHESAGEIDSVKSGDPALHEGKAILIVDDNEAIRKVVRKLLEHARFVVQEVASGPEAIEVCNKKAPSLILMDVRMPGMDGVAAATRIREQLGPACPPIIGLTGDLIRPDGSAMQDKCFDDVLSKPFRKEELVRVANEFIGHTSS